MDGGAVGLLAGDFVDVNDELLAVHADNLANVALVVAASHLQSFFMRTHVAIIISKIQHI